MSEPTLDDLQAELNELKSAILVADSEEKAGLYERMGDVYRAMDQGNRALVCYREAHDAGHAGPDFIIKYATQMTEKGKARDGLELMKEASESTEDDTSKARLLVRCGLATRLLGDFEDGIEMGRKALGILDILEATPSNRLLRAEAHTAMALNLWRQGIFEEAGEHLRDALVIYEEMDDEDGLSDVYNHLGIVTSLTGDQKLALEFYERSRAIRDKARVYINMGIVRMILGDYDRAEENFKTAVKKARAEGYKLAVHLSELNLGEVNIKRKNAVKAKPWVARAEKGYREMGENPRASLVMSARAQVQLLEKDVEGARRTAVAALEMAEEHGIKDAWARILHVLGLVEIADGDPERAVTLFEKSIEMMERIHLVRYVGPVYLDLAIARLELGQDREASEATARAREILEAQDARAELSRLDALDL